MATTTSVISITYHMLSAPKTIGNTIIIPPLTTAPLANEAIIDVFLIIPLYQEIPLSGSKYILRLTQNKEVLL